MTGLRPGWMIALLAAWSYAHAVYAADAGPGRVIVVQTEGLVEMARVREAQWIQAITNQVLLPGDQLRTGRRSRAVVQLADLTLVRLAPFSELQVAGPERRETGLLRGMFYFFHRAPPGTTPIRTPTVSAVVRGTEYLVAVNADETTISVVDGEVAVQAPGGSVTVNARQEAFTSQGRVEVRPSRGAGELVQWVLHFPAVLNLREAGELGPAWEEAAQAYRLGAVRRAVGLMPEQEPATTGEIIFAATLELAAGETAAAQALLERATGNEPSIVSGFRRLIAAVLGEDLAILPEPASSTEWLGFAYYLQSRGELDAARRAVERALALDPNFGLARVKLAELHFSSGFLERARDEAFGARVLMPDAADTYLIEGFYLAAQNRLAQAEGQFTGAIELEPALAEAWLGRGLVLMRRGQIEDGRRQMETAVVLDPLRSIFRSNLGKGYFFGGFRKEAFRDLTLAKELDPADPTPWLYTGLLREQQNELNRAILELEESQNRVSARRIYRSRQLLREDRAVRSANLARIYHDASLENESVREAATAVAEDYGNYSAHLFLANSYGQLRDPRQTMLRYDQPWLRETLLANLLAPVGGTPLSTHLSLHEYTPLFERDHFGIASSSEYWTSGDWMQTGSVYGRDGPSSYSADAAYSSLNGSGPNAEFEQLTLSGQFKHQLILNDSLYVHIVGYEAKGGDIAPRYDSNRAANGREVTERQRPLAMIGYHREWQPGMHTLALAGYFNDTLEVTDPDASRLLFARDAAGAFEETRTVPLQSAYKSEFDLWHVELQQIAQLGRHTAILGTRADGGEIEAMNIESATPRTGLPSFYFPERSAARENVERWSGYLYDHWQVMDDLVLIGGLDYTVSSYPENFRFGPLTSEDSREETWSPKAGFVWSPTPWTTMRGAYAKSLGGISFENSFSLEPSQIAGFTQSYRSVAPESFAGSLIAEAQEVAAIGLAQRLTKRTFAGLSFEHLDSDAPRRFGAYELVLAPPLQLRQLTEDIQFQESLFTADVQHLLADEWSIGGMYRISRARLTGEVREARFASTAGNNPKQSLESTLHHSRLNVLFNHRSGFFSRGEAHWFVQDNEASSENFGQDSFWHLNLYAGIRFWDRRGEIRAGLINILDQDFRASPLNFWLEPYRERTATLRVRFIW